MLKPTFKLKQVLSLTLPVVLLSACGGGSSSDSKPETPDPTPTTSTFSLAVSDAPVDALSEVVVCFNQIELKSSGDDVVFTVGEEEGMLEANELCLDDNDQVIANTVGINLLDYQGSESINLVQGMTIPAGSYSQMRLIMAEGSYGIDQETGEKIAVSVPSNELKLDGFTAAAGGAVDFTLEFDLRKSMTNPKGQSDYFLKPRGVRLVNNIDAGHIQGTITETVLLNNLCEPLSDSTTSPATAYLYQGFDLPLESLADNGGSEENQPLASASVKFDAEQITYQFAIGFVNAGDYTVALTCETFDDPEVDDEIVFFQGQNVTVEAGNQATVVNFDVE
ncbi:DUF4382 domain-containing protein [Colwellia sp. MEBiC06753]